MTKKAATNGHHHFYRALDKPWRKERMVTRTVVRYRGLTERPVKVKRKQCEKYGPLLQTVMCAGCADRKEIVIREVCG